MYFFLESSPKDVYNRYRWRKQQGIYNLNLNVQIQSIKYWVSIVHIRIQNTRYKMYL